MNPIKSHRCKFSCNYVSMERCDVMYLAYFLWFIVVVYLVQIPFSRRIQPTGPRQPTPCIIIIIIIIIILLLLTDVNITYAVDIRRN